MVNDNNWVDIYRIDIDKRLDKKKILILGLCIIILIILIFIINYSIKVINGYKVYKQYETQLASIKYQEQEKQNKINSEEERKRQEKIPKLTEKRKGKYIKHI
ncbi:MAG: hypothetical protein HFJ40_07655 [Clostridia bacterium]|nr:hypothetical protein [Clostridia bacterium]